MGRRWLKKFAARQVACMHVPRCAGWCSWRIEPVPLLHLVMVQRTATAARKGSQGARREKSVGTDFPGGTTGFYLTVLGFVAFAAASLYWVIVLSYPKD